MTLNDRIRQKAYEIWQYRQEMGQYLIVDNLGNVRKLTAQDDWLEAEFQVLQEGKCLGNDAQDTTAFVQNATEI